MRINLAIIISLLVLIFGFAAGKPYLWIPVSFFIAGIVDLFTRGWAHSDRLGSAQTFSMLLKLLLNMIIFYAMVGQVICVVLLIWWLFI